MSDTARPCDFELITGFIYSWKGRGELMTQCTNPHPTKKVSLGDTRQQELAGALACH